MSYKKDLSDYNKAINTPERRIEKNKKEEPISNTEESSVNVVYNIKLAIILLSIMGIILFLFFRKQADPGIGNSIRKDNVTISVTNAAIAADSIKNNYNNTLKVHVENFSGRDISYVCIKGYLHKISDDSPKYRGGTDVISFRLPCYIENENAAELFTSINSNMTPGEEFRILDACIHYAGDGMYTSSGNGVSGYYKVRGITGLSRGITHTF